MVFDQVREDPPEATVLAAAELGRSRAVDGVIAVGGGSSMDVAKVVAVLLGGEPAIGAVVRRRSGRRWTLAPGTGAHHGRYGIRGDAGGSHNHR